MRRKKPLKACMDCKSLVPREAEVCPFCGSVNLTENWEGAIIIISEKSELLGELEYLKKPGRYAVEVAASE
jgi:DNA-directed RNA polymerase subunit E"